MLFIQIRWLATFDFSTNWLPFGASCHSSNPLPVGLKQEMVIITARCKKQSALQKLFAK